MDPGKFEINIGLKKMSDFRELYFIKTMRNAVCYLKVHKCMKKNKTKTNKQKRLRFCSSNIACQQYWSSEQICSELKVWMSNFLNIKSSRPSISCKKGVLKIKNLQNSLKIIRYAVFKSIEFQAKLQRFYWKET